MTRIRDKHTFYFMLVYYEGYTDTYESEASFRAEPYNVILIEGKDYDSKDVTYVGLSIMAWMKAINVSSMSIDNVVEIKLLGVDHGKSEERRI